MAENNSNILKIGISGVGHMGQYHVNVLSSLSTHEIVGIHDSDTVRAKEIAEKFNLPVYENIEELLEKTDAITVAVPTVNHYDIAKKALEFDNHVLVEKPITETLEQARELIDLAKSKNKILQVGHVERFNGAVMELQKITNNPSLITTRRMSPFAGRINDVGVVLDLLIHDLDIVLNLVKAPVKEYWASGSRSKTSYEDNAQIGLLFENGCTANLIASRMSQKKERSLSVVQDESFIFLNYTNQDIEIHRQGSSASLLTKERIRYSQESFVEKLFIHKDNPLKSEHVHFYRTIKEKENPFVPNEKDLETLSIALGSLEKIRGLWDDYGKKESD